MIQSGLGVWVFNAEHNIKKEEFVPPETSPLYSADPNEVYIEAVDDEPFGIIIRPFGDFQTHGAAALCVELNIDGIIRSNRTHVLGQGDTCGEVRSVTMSKDGVSGQHGLVFNTMKLGK